MRKFAELAQRVFGRLRKHRGLVALALVAGVLLLPKMSYAVSLDRFFLNPFDSTALLLAGVINNIAAVVGKVMLVVLEMIIVPILGYNGFASADIVDLGWSLVRDVVNMGVVVILIVIAMQTIVGYSKANWTQQLPRLFIGVILVNFSRTICGVLIDISQVVMFTFVNAIIDIAAGNFAQMFGLSSFGEFSNEFIDKVNESGTGIEAYAYLGSAYLQLALYLAIFSVILLLALMYIWRIVILWLLIIMSPVAFFLNGIGDMFKAASGYYGEWWKKFSGALIMGPLLTFFLWLALAAASGSNLAVTQDFPLPDEPGEYGLSLENFSLDSLLGTFVAMILLIVGMQLASSSAGAIGGPVAKFISEDFGKKIAGAAVRYPAALAGRGAMAGARFADKKIGQRIDADVRTGTKRGSLTSHLGAAGIQFGQSVSDIPVVGGAIGGMIAGAGGSIIAGNKAKKAEERKKAQETVKGLDSEHRDRLIADMADGGKMFGALPKEQQDALHASLATDVKAQKRAEKTLGKDKYDNLMKSVISNADANKDDWFDDAGKAALVGTKLANLHNIEPKDAKAGDADYDAKKQTAVKEYLDDLNKDGKLTATSARLIGPDAIKDKSVASVLNGYVYRTDKNDNKVTIGNDISSGKLTQKQREAANQSDAWRGENEVIERTADGGYMRRPRPVNVEALKPPTAGDPDYDAKMAAMTGELEYAERWPDMNMAGSPTSQPEAQEAIKGAVKAIKPGSISVQSAAKIDESLLNAGHSASSVYGATPPADSPEFAYQRARFEQLLKSDPENARHFSEATPDGVRSNEVTKALTETVKPDQVREMGEKLASQKGADREKTKGALKNMENAIKAERKRIGAGATGAEAERISRLEQAYTMASRYAKF